MVPVWDLLFLDHTCSTEGTCSATMENSAAKRSSVVFRSPTLCKYNALGACQPRLRMELRKRNQRQRLVAATRTNSTTTTTTTTSSDAPVLNHAQPCWDSCGGKAGSCPQHCGQRGACCKLGHVAEKGHEAGGSRHGAGLGFVIPRPHVQHRGDLQCHHGKLGCKEEFCCVQKPDFV
mmetsp:Transcript_4014/g.7486  ORF Transcript_4014/g.7486 Transcript_4014/m.7486 type:complete len:177 (+) Transcript_4014:149-679(+)